jgi:Mor family transcriptional regulator
MPSITKGVLIMMQKIYETDEAIGSRLHLTRQAVHKMRQFYGIPSVVAYNPRRNKKIVALYNNRNPVRLIAEKFDLSISSVYRIIKGAGR